MTSEEQFVLEEERHRELLKAFKSLADRIPQNKIDPSVVQEIKNELEGLKEAVLKAPVPEAQNIDMSGFEERMARMMAQFTSRITESLDALQAVIVMNNQPREYEHTLHRNRFSEKVDKVVSKEIRKIDA